MSRYESEAHTTTQSLVDLIDTARRLGQYAADHPGQRVTCHIVLDLPEPPPDYQPDTTL